MSSFIIYDAEVAKCQAWTFKFIFFNLNTNIVE